MRLRSPRASLALTCSLVTLPLACGGEPPPPPAAPAPPVASAAPPPPPDLSEVPAPASLVATARFARLSDTLATAHGWTQVPMPASEQVSEIVSGEAIGPVVDLDQPLDVAVAVVGSGLRASPEVVVSAAVREPDKVRARLAERYKLAPGEAGMTVVTGLGKPTADDGDEGEAGDARTCALAPSFGAAPVRLVCGFGKTALRDLGPWITRTLTRSTPHGDLHVDVRTQPVRATLAAGKSLAGAMLSGVLFGGVRAPALRELTSSLGSDLADLAADLDTASLDLSATPGGAEVRGTLHLTSHASALGQLAAAHPERGAAAPAAFARMPADTDLALFEGGVDEGPAARGRELVAAAIAQWLEAAGVPAIDAKGLGAATGKLIPSAAVSYASGLDLAAVRKATELSQSVAGDAPPAKVTDPTLPESEALLGWRMLAIEAPPAPVQAAMRQLSAALAKPSILAGLRARDKDARAVVLRQGPAVHAAGLPAGTSHWVLEVPRDEPHRKPAVAPRPLLWHLLLAAEGNRTWIAVGGDEAAVASRLGATLGSTAPRLGAREDLAFLRDGKLGAAWAATPRALVEGGLQWAAGAGESPAHLHWRILDELEKTPNHAAGMTALTVSAGASGEVTVSAHAPKTVIEDVLTEMIRRGGL